MSRAQQGRAKHASKSSSRSKRARQQKHTSVDDEMQEIETRCQELVTSKAALHRFEELPITSKTKVGLRRAAFVEMTAIQAKSLPLALARRDILGAAQTGSGKTLAFVIPVLERLFREKWGPSDGLGALILSPTRELAIQIFEVLRKVGSTHTFSAGLVIGGKDVKAEKERLTRMNILVATPGRLLQHMDQTVGFDASNLQVLVLDEADRCLDMGFANTLDAILENLPKENRQTLLFSATQTKRVKDLARLSLSSPEYVAIQSASGSQNVLPPALSQHYMVISLPRKLSVLYSFLRTHVKSKILVFFSACRQVQFAHETFCKMRPGVPLMCLHGKQKQTKRSDIFNAFTRSQYAVLLATDVAARGLDFPKVDWVIQVDSPEDADTYIHRVGRTARYNNKGNSLIFVLPSEETGLLKMLKAKEIKPDVIKPKDSKIQDIRDQLQGILFKDTELKYLAQKAFVSYIRSIYLQRDKATFDVTQLPLEEYAASLGLAGAPKVKFVKEAQAAKKKAERLLAKEAMRNGEKSSTQAKGSRAIDGRYQGVLSEHYRKLIADDEDTDDGSDGQKGQSASERNASDDEGDEEEQSSDEEHGPRYKQAQAHRGSEDSESSEEEDKHQAAIEDSGDDDDDDDFLTLRRPNHDFEIANAEGSQGAPSKRQIQIGASKKRMAAAGLRGLGEKVIFDEDGKPRKVYEMQDESTLGDARKAADEFVERERASLQERDVEDKARVREKRLEKKRKMREREQQERMQRSEEAGAVLIAPHDDREDGYETPDFDLSSEVGTDGQQSSDSEEETARPAKRAKPSANDLAADEDLALKLLGAQ